MPLPKPREDEDKGAFVGRCMSELKEEYPDQAQRAAVCYAQWRRKEDTVRSWYEIRNATADEAEVLMYDEIGTWGITASDFAKELQGVKAKTINLRINSPGGDVFDGVAIYNALKNHPAVVHVVVDGLAASSASFIAQAGDTVLMGMGSAMMIHEPFGGIDASIRGDADNIRSVIQEAERLISALDAVGGNIASIYAGRAGGDEPLWRSRMRVESWYRAQEAVDIGLADGLVGSKVQNRVGIFNLAKFHNVPDWVPQAVAPPIEEPDPEPPPEPSPILEGVKEGVGGIVKRAGLPPFDFKQAVKTGVTREGDD